MTKRVMNFLVISCNINDQNIYDDIIIISKWCNQIVLNLSKILFFINLKSDTLKQCPI